MIASKKRKVACNGRFLKYNNLSRHPNVVETARKVIDPTSIKKISAELKKLADAKLPRSIFKQLASDLQLKDLLAKTEELDARANFAFAKSVSRFRLSVVNIR